jgi:signal transduction histidine kinase
VGESATPDIAIPSDVLRKWQRIVDLLARIMNVPSAVVTTIAPPYSSYRTLVSSASAGNPFPVDENFSMDIGTFCETVIKNREPLLVANALDQDQWKRAPEIGLGMVSYLGFPVLWPDGRMFGTICVLDDKANRYSDLYQELLTHCRDVLQGDLQTLARLGHELAHANRTATLGQLSASIAHELNQPLTGILTNCGTCLRMLTSDPLNLDGAREAVRRTMRDGNRAADVITRLRALFNRSNAASESVDLNLLRNALDAMTTVDDRPRDLLIRTERAEGDWVRLSVKDAGVGFDPHTADRLFEPFYSTKNDGMGVGLSVSRSIIENHQGRLWAVLNDGPGATFSFSVPCRGGTTVL